MNVAYYFYSDSCPPCVALKPVISDLKEEFSQVAWVSINTKEDTEGLAKQFGVAVTPTIVLVQPSGTSEKYSGTSPMGYYRMFRNATR
jgi:thiol-disulfide isomerase/thioredoxin